jgi:hypothetical protein
MNFQIGDRVRFLNEKGEGIIRSINKQFATVEIEEGFDIPFLMAELVKVHTEEKKVHHSPLILPEPHKFLYDTLEKTSFSNELSGALKGEDVYLAFVPKEEQKLLSGQLLVYLVNNTRYQIVYSYSTTKNNEDTGLGAGVLLRNTEVYLHSVSRQDLEKLSGVFVQLLFHNNTGFKARVPVQERIAIKPAYFNNIDKLKNLDSINKHAFILPVYKDDPLPVYAKPAVPFPAAVSKKKQHSNPVIKTADALFKAFNNEIEIDLHIEELTSFFSGMSNSEIVNMQLAHFHKCMDKAMTAHVHRVVFIHGVGNGTLKKALRDELKSYKGIRVEDGAYDKYGSGATSVIFLH